MTPPNRFSDLADAIDRLFDRELSRAERERLSAELAADPEALRRFRETTDALLELRKPIDTPDVTAAVLARLDARPGFTTRRTRRIITTTRLVAAAALLGAGAGVLVLQQFPQPDPGALARSRAAERSLDPLRTRLYDPELAAEELANLDLSPFDAARAGQGLLSGTPALSTPRLELDITSLHIWAGASDVSDRSLLPHADRPLMLDLPWAARRDFNPFALTDPFVDSPRLDDAALWTRPIGLGPAGSLLGPGLEFTRPPLQTDRPEPVVPGTTGG